MKHQNCQRGRGMRIELISINRRAKKQPTYSKISLSYHSSPTNPLGDTITVTMGKSQHDVNGDELFRAIKSLVKSTEELLERQGG